MSHQPRSLHYLARCLAGLNSFTNILTFGDPDERLAVRAARAAERGKPWGRAVLDLLDAACESDRERRELAKAIGADTCGFKTRSESIDAATVRIYFNSHAEAPLIWSLDFGTQETERKLSKITFVQVSGAVEEDPDVPQGDTEHPRVWIELRRVIVHFEGDRATVFQNPDWWERS